MPIGEVFGKSIKIIWNHKSLILLGFLAGLATFVIGLIIHFVFDPRLLQDISSSGIDSFLNQLSSDYAVWIAGGSIILFVGFIAAWIINTIAEGALIRGVSESGQGNSLTFGQAWTAGAHLLKQFIAIDTVLFFPAFLILLLIMLTILGTLVALILVGINPGMALEKLLIIASAGGIVTIPLTCMLIPVFIVVYFLRIFAFREAAIAKRNSMDSIHHAFRLIWNRKGSVAILALMLWALGYASRLPFQALSLMLTILSLTIAFSATEDPIINLILTVSGFFIALLSWIVGSVIFTLTSAVWTLSFEDFVEPEGINN